MSDFSEQVPPGTLLALNDITKTYPGVIALNGLSMGFRPGEVHALLGENGAGKSTLIKVVAGAIAPDRGSIHMGGQPIPRMTPSLARSLGIEVIYQEFNLVPTLSAAENISLGVHKHWRVDRKAMYTRAKNIFNELQVHVDPDAFVRDLPSSQQQLVEIAKALARNPRVLIMDEPTAPLSTQEVQRLFRVIRKVRARGTAVIYISHRMDEIFDIADYVSVLRDGRWIKTLRCEETDRPTLIKLMVGRELSESYPVRAPMSGEVAMELRNVTGNGNRDVSFSLRRGEILGVAGLVGAGRTELARLIFGAAPIESGEIRVQGKPTQFRSTRHAIRHGIGLIPENRKEEGCFLEQSVNWNISIAALRFLRRWGMVDVRAETRLANAYVQRLQVKTPSLNQRVKNLSGGNQQKVVIAKTLASQSTILLFDEPTRGIDVGARHEIYKLMVDLAAQGNAILMITSDMEELLGMSDRILVLSKGRMAGLLDRKACSQERVLALASGES